MSGHSKWSQIKRQKEISDIKRGKTFTKLSNAITMAVKQGGGITDPTQNMKLRFAVDEAKSHNMPKENIERSIKRAVAKEYESLAEVLYEGFAPGGFPVIVEAVTDNPNRTSSQIKSVFSREGGILASPGSVMYQFEQVGEIVVSKEGESEEDVFTKAIDAGALDIEDQGSQTIVFCPPKDIGVVSQKLRELGLSILSSGLVWKPVSYASLEDSQTVDKAVKFINRIEELEDVQKVYSNIKY